MRILHINAGNLYGGVETFLVTLARHANGCAGMESEFACCFNGRFREELKAAGVPVYSLGGVRTSRPWTVWRARRRLRELLERTPFDAVISHMPWNHAVFGPEVKRTGAKLVFWQHDVASGESWVEKWARRTRPDLVISDSRFTVSSLSHLFPNVPSQVIYYPVTLPPVCTEEGRALRREMGVPEEMVVILQVSRMEAWKGHLLHLEALSQIKDKAGWTCWMVGGPQKREEEQYLSMLRRTAAELGVTDRVQFLGQRSDVPRLMAAADIFCQPNQGPEPFGIVFIEALWAGLPVLTTAMGGPLEIVDESCGFLVEPGHAQLLAESLGRLIESRDLRSRLGKAGAARARELCDPVTQIGKLRELSERVTGCASGL